MMRTLLCFLIGTALLAVGFASGTIRSNSIIEGHVERGNYLQSRIDALEQEASEATRMNPFYPPRCKPFVRVIGVGRDADGKPHIYLQSVFPQGTKSHSGKVVDAVGWGGSSLEEIISNKEWMTDLVKGVK